MRIGSELVSLDNFVNQKQLPDFGGNYSIFVVVVQLIGRQMMTEIS